MKTNISIIFLMVFLAFTSTGQVRLEGEIIHDDAHAEHVTIQIIENGRMVRTVAASKRGKYEIDFPYGHDYVLVFRAPYMIPAKILVNTEHAQAEVKSVLIDVPLNMELFHRFKGMDIKAYDTPIGEVKSAGDGEDSFDFFTDASNLAKIKAVNDESRTRKAAGENPIDVVEVPKTNISEPKPKNIEIPVISKEAIESTKSTEAETNRALAEDEFSDGDVIEKSADEMRIDKVITRYEKLEQGENERIEMERSTKGISNEASVSESEQQVDHITEGKITRQHIQEEEAIAEDKIVDAKVRKLEKVEVDLAASAKSVNMSVRSRVSDDRVPVEVYSNPGTFINEEVLIVNESGIQTTFHCVKYNWFFFDTEYYYKNDKEISEADYNEVKRLFK